MRYFLDTEFIEDGKTIDLISLAIVAEDGREFYAESEECDLSKASEWVRENVVPHLWSRKKDHREHNAWSRDGGSGGLMDRVSIARGVRLFCDQDTHGKPEFWGYYADYDWVALCQLWGTMMDLPKGFPMFCMDLKQLCVMRGNPRLPKMEHGEHNALADARWNRDMHAMLTSVAVELPL